MKAVFISCFSHYDTRIKYFEDFFKAQGIETILLFSSFDHISKSPKKYDLPNVRPIKVPPYKTNISLQRIRSHIIFANSVKRELDRIKPDYIYTIVPPNHICKRLAKYKKENPNVKIIYDIYDLWPETFPLWIIKKENIWRKLRDDNMWAADKVYLECEYYTRLLRKVTDPEKTEVLHLTREDLGMTDITPATDRMEFCYLGSINNIFDTENIVRFLSEANKKKKVLFHVVGDGEKREELITALDAAGIDYEYHGIIYDKEELKKIFAHTSFAINMYRKDVEIGITMKSIDYLQLSIPIINMNIKDMALYLREYRAGFTVNEENLEHAAGRIADIDPEKWQKLHYNSRRLFLEVFSEEKFRKRLNKSLSQLVR